MSVNLQTVGVTTALFGALVITACGGGSGDANPVEPQTFRVGRTSIEWTDSARAERCGGVVAGTPRRLKADLWYPANPATGAATAPLLSDAEVVFFSQPPELAPAATLRKIPSDSYLDAPVASSSAAFPVLLMSHGAGSLPLASASTAESLAAKGYVVVGLSHPYHTVATFFSNGDVLTIDPGCDPAGAQPEIGPDSTYADYTANWQYTVALDAYLTADFGSTLAKLASINANDARFAGRLKLDRVGAFGHSFGGSHAFRALRELPGVVAAADIDGTVYSDDLAAGAGTGKAYLALLGGDWPSPSEVAAESTRLQAAGMTAAQANEVVGRGDPQKAYLASHPSYLATIPTALHLDFTDFGLWAAHGVPVDPMEVTVADTKAILEVQNTLLRKFFDRHVRSLPVDVAVPATRLRGITLEAKP